MSAEGRRRRLSFCLQGMETWLLNAENLCTLYQGSNQNLPANQRPWSALTVAIAAGIDGHFTYTFPYKAKQE